MSRRFESCWGWLLVAVCAPLLASAAPAAPPPLAPSPAAPVSADRSAQRAQFLLAYAAAKLGGSAWRTLASGLADYPLYPYLEAAALSHDLAHADGKAVEAYIARYPGLIPARDLRRDYLHRLAGAAQWDDFRRLYRPDLGLALACRDLQARLATGQTLDFARDYSTLWKADDWPAACKPALEWARDHQLLTRQRLWQRVERLASEGSASAIEDTARWMRTTDAAVAKRIALARRSPMTALRHASGWKSDAHTRLAVALALQRLARQDEQAAQRNWDKLQPRFTFTPTQNHAIQAAIALYAA
ncbi:MAG TPA: lytic murein transglycosylase, partial [Rhodanobacteraceae bacterium]|nr:lytic murein transglycosylase [Rhodanobacteraceae bacterium]